MATKTIRVPLGRELNWTDQEMDLFLEVQVSDILQAKLLVAESLDPLFSSILEAEDEEVI